jgi:hypothetical protein
MLGRFAFALPASFVSEQDCVCTGEIFSDPSISLKIVLGSDVGAKGQVVHLDLLGSGGFVACVGMPPLNTDGGIKHLTLQDDSSIPGTRVWKRSSADMADFARITQQVAAACETSLHSRYFLFGRYLHQSNSDCG